jgi:transcription elongation factor Elf1
MFRVSKRPTTQSHFSLREKCIHKEGANPETKTYNTPDINETNMGGKGMAICKDCEIRVDMEVTAYNRQRSVREYNCPNCGAHAKRKSSKMNRSAPSKWEGDTDTITVETIPYDEVDKYERE